MTTDTDQTLTELAHWAAVERDAMRTRNQLIADLFQAGASPTRIATAAGLTRQGVHFVAKGAA